MPDIHLIVADQALRGAIAEQLQLLAANDLRLYEGTNIPAALNGDTPVALIIDGSLLGGKMGKALRDAQDKNKRLKIFVLGESETEMEENFVTESFAKPLRLGHLMARLHFFLQTSAQGDPLTFGPFRLEPQARQVIRHKTGAAIRLTEKEAQLLEYLGRSDKPVNREELLAAIWGYDARIDTHTLETHIYRLRRKLDPHNEGINSIVASYGAYRLMTEIS